MNGNGNNNEKKNGNGANAKDDQNLESIVEPHEKVFDIYMDNCPNQVDDKKFVYNLAKKINSQIDSSHVFKNGENGKPYKEVFELDDNGEIILYKEKNNIDFTISSYKDDLHDILYSVLEFYAPEKVRVFFYENESNAKLDLPKYFNKVLDKYQPLRTQGLTSSNMASMEFKRKSKEEIEKADKMFNTI